MIDKIEALASDECPIIAFLPIDGNDLFLDWIQQSLASSCARDTKPERG